MFDIQKETVELYSLRVFKNVFMYILFVNLRL